MSAEFEQFLGMAERELPQFPYIKRSNAKRWFDTVAANKELNLETEFWKLKHLGESESAIIVANILGEMAPNKVFPADVYRRKMMIDLPEVISPAKEFSLEHEDETRALFEKEYAEQYGWTRADDLMAQLHAELRGSEYTQALSYSGGDLFYTTDNQIVLVNYHTPYRNVVPEVAPLKYSCQTHQGLVVYKDALGVDIDQMILVYGVHPKSFVPNRTKELYIEAMEIIRDETIEQLIKYKASEFMTESVWQGQEPNVNTLEIAKQLEALDKEYTALRVDEKDSKAEADVVAAKMSEIIAGLNLVERKEVVSRMDTYARPSVTEIIPEMTDEETELAIKARMGDNVDIKTFQKSVDITFDPEKVLAKFLELHPDFDMSEFEVKKISWNKQELLDKGVISRDDVTTKVTWSLSKKTLAQIGNINPASEGGLKEPVGEETSIEKKGLSPE